jgi:hypothetical protein
VVEILFSESAYRNNARTLKNKLITTKFFIHHDLARFDQIASPTLQQKEQPATIGFMDDEQNLILDASSVSECSSLVIQK